MEMRSMIKIVQDMCHNETANNNSVSPLCAGGVKRVSHLWNLNTINIMLALLFLALTGCLHVAPDAGSPLTEDDLQFCIAKMTLDYFRSDFYCNTAHTQNILLKEGHYENCIAQISPRKGATRTFKLEQDFILPFKNNITNRADCEAFWNNLQLNYPEAWNRLCSQYNEDMNTWIPPLPNDAANGNANRVLYIISVSAFENIYRKDINNTEQRFQFSVTLTDIKYIERLSATTTVDRRWTRSKIKL